MNSLAELATAVSHSQDPDGSVREAASEALLEFQSTNILGFVTSLHGIIASDAFPDNSKKLSIIYCNKTLNHLRDHPARAQFLASPLASELLATATSLFPIFSDNASALFSSVAIMILDANPEATIISEMLEQLGRTTHQAFVAACYHAIALICYENDHSLPTHQLHGILKSVFAVLTNIDAPLQIRVECLDILHTLTKRMSDVLSNPTNADTTLEVLIFSLRFPETRAISYRCFARLARNYYAIFTEKVSAVMETASQDIHDIENGPVINAICTLLTKIAISESILEDEGEEHLNVISETFPTFAELLFQVAISHRKELPDPDDAFDQFIDARETICRLIRLRQSICVPIALELVGPNLESPEPNRREEAVAILACCCQLQIEEIVGQAVEALKASLADAAPRVRHRAVSDLALALRSNATAIAALKELLPTFLELLTDDASSEIGISTCRLLGKLAKRTAIPAFDQIFERYLQVVATESAQFSMVLGWAMIRIIDRAADIDLVLQAIPAVVRLVEGTFTDPALHGNCRDIIDVFCKFSMKVGGALTEFVPQLLPLFLEAVADPSADSSLILAISTLATGVCKGARGKLPFEPFLPRMMELVLQLIGRDDIEALDNACLAVLDLHPDYNLSAFVPRLTDELATVLEADEADVRMFCSVLELFSGKFISVRDRSAMVTRRNPYADACQSATLRIIRLTALHIEELATFRQWPQFGIAVLEFYNMVFDGEPATARQWMAIGLQLIVGAQCMLGDEDLTDKDKDRIRVMVTELIGHLANCDWEAITEFITGDGRELVMELRQSADGRARGEMRRILRDLELTDEFPVQ
jgi:hypothetical protein